MQWIRRLFGMLFASGAASVRDGSSPRRAIAVSEVAEEYRWVRSHAAGFEVERQRLVQVGGKPYDALSLRAPSGEVREVFFDVSNILRRR
jgi:hypothetical protein